MSLHLCTRPGVAVSSVPVDSPVFVLGQGAGSTYWRVGHPLIDLALQYAPAVYSFQLPLHGSNAQRKLSRPFETLADRQEYAKQVKQDAYELIAPIVKKRYVIFIGYSTSGILFTSLFHRFRIECDLHPLSMLLNLGTGLLIGSTQAMVQQFWQEESFMEDSRRHAAMQAQHRVKDTSKPGPDDESWRHTVRLAGFLAGNAKSGMFPTAEERTVLLGGGELMTFDERRAQPPGAKQTDATNYVFFMQGEHDEPFPPVECLQSVLESIPLSPSSIARRLTILPDGGHFNYFIPTDKGGSLETMLSAAARIINTFGEKDILDRYRSDETNAAAKKKTTNRTQIAPSNTSASVSASSPSSTSAVGEFSPRRVLIVGSGVFGVSSARALARRYPLAQIILLEQSPSFPSQRATSQDINRIVRADYGTDQLYTRWGMESIAGWHAFNARHGEEVYRQTGVLFLTGRASMEAPGAGEPASYEYDSWRTLQSPPFSQPLLRLQPAAVNTPPRPSAVLEKHFPYWHESQSHVTHGYYNPHGGYVDAGRAIVLEVEDLKRTHPRFELRTNARVIRIETEQVRSKTSEATRSNTYSHSHPPPHRRAIGVTLATGEFIAADLVLMATGAWTLELLPELTGTIKQTPQPVLFVRPNRKTRKENTIFSLRPEVDTSLSGDDVSIYSCKSTQSILPQELSIPPTSSTSSPTLASTAFPVFSFDLSRLGWYGFCEDDASGIIKIGHHGTGLDTAIHVGPDGRRTLQHETIKQFEKFIQQYMPHLYEHGELVDAKSCYYTDSFDGDFLMDYHPSIDGLFVATAGSGHAFKFMPILGDVIVDLLESRRSPSLDLASSVSSISSRFAWRSPTPVRQTDVCRSTSTLQSNDPERETTPTPQQQRRATTRFAQSVQTFLAATGQTELSNTNITAKL